MSSNKCGQQAVGCVRDRYNNHPHMNSLEGGVFFLKKKKSFDKNISTRTRGASLFLHAQFPTVPTIKLPLLLKPWSQL